MNVSAKKIDGAFRIVGDWDDTASANAFLGHLDARAFSPSTVRSYAFDIVNFARFLLARESTLVEVSPMMVFEWEEAERRYFSESSMLELTTINNPVEILDEAVILPELAAA